MQLGQCHLKTGMAKVLAGGRGIIVLPQQRGGRTELNPRRILANTSSSPANIRFATGVSDTYHSTTISRECSSSEFTWKTTQSVAPPNEAQRPKMKTAKIPRKKLPAKIRGKKDPNTYPKGWNRQRVQAVLLHYENQSEDEAVAEDEAAYKSPTSTMIQVPSELVPKVQKLIAKKRAS